MAGPWSDLPPEPPRPRERPFRLPGRRGGVREPFIRNWRALAIVAFLLFLAPPLASWLARVILGLLQGR